MGIDDRCFAALLRGAAMRTILRRRANSNAMTPLVIIAPESLSVVAENVAARVP